MTFDELKEKAHSLPLKPGVYIMQDAKNTVIYVGKAKALKNRVSQYFQDSASHTEKTRAMVSQIDHFDVIIADSEFEALVLENSLIKRHQPRYNILLKDDKGYPYIRLSNEAVPPLLPGLQGGPGRGPVLRPLRQPPQHAGHPGRPALRPPAAHLPEEVPPGHWQGAPLPQLPYGQVRRLLPQFGYGGAAPAGHRPGGLPAGGAL